MAPGGSVAEAGAVGGAAAAEAGDDDDMASAMISAMVEEADLYDAVSFSSSFVYFSCLLYF